MFVRFSKSMLLALAVSTISIGSITTVSAKPGDCSPAVTSPTTCSDCHNGVPGINTYIPGACAKMSNAVQPQGVVTQPPVPNGKQGGAIMSPTNTQAKMDDKNKDSNNNDEDDEDDDD